MSLLVNEIFYSIQGESLWSGLSCVFIRMSGCNLRCRFCDTQYAYEQGEPMGINEITAQAARFKCPRITITGGEPLLQKETLSLVSHLIEDGYSVSVETNGSINIGDLDRRCMRVVDLKCPSSGMQHYNCMENMRLLCPSDQLKFVIANKLDFDFAAAISNSIASDPEADHILFSPVHGVLSPDKLASWMLDSRVPGRLQIQLHKILWPHKDRGV